MSHTLDCFLAENERQAFRMAQMAIGHHDDALDIVQEAMIKLVTKYGERESSEWPPLFYRILQNQILMWYRSKKVKQKFFGWLGVSDDNDDDKSEVVQYEDVSAKRPENILLTDQAMDKLNSALQALPIRQRQVFLLRCWQGFDTKETADAMECSSGTVKTHYHRALHSLRDKLGDVWP